MDAPLESAYKHLRHQRGKALLKMELNSQVKGQRRVENATTLFCPFLRAKKGVKHTVINSFHRKVGL
ncbi:hypothetical protein UP17_11860 [Peribacillus simplex]|nr:hypothetical protein UP17_11860 [Peribacillus simplex]